MMTRKIRALRLAVAAAALSLPALGCDVVNPGQILDDDLNTEAALRIVVNGLGGDVSVAQTDLGWNLNVMTGDMSGTSAYKTRFQHWQGRPDAEDADEYNSLYKAVAVGDLAIERIKTVLGGGEATSQVAAEAYLWTGFANEMAGDAFCKAVIGGGAPQDRSVYHQRAEGYFTQAIGIATAAGPANVLTAAYGGRAHVRAQLGKWPEALADAARVPTSFQFDYKKDAAASREWNRIFYENQTRVNINIRWTWFHDYAQRTSDPRVPWRTVAGKTAADGSGIQVMQNKYANLGADIAATKGLEMRLLEAEYYITQTSNWATGLAIVNGIRTAAGMPAWPASNAAEAFTALKLERGIVLWLESRRMGDLYRWGGTATGDPIIAAMYQLTPAPAVYSGGAGGLVIPQDQRAVCMPFSLILLGTNENVRAGG